MDNHLHPTSDAKKKKKKTKTINDVIPSTDLYTTLEYTEYYTVL